MGRDRTRVEPEARVLAGAPARLVFGQHVWCYKCKGLGKVRDADGKRQKCTHCGGLSILDRGATEEEQAEDDTS